MFKRPTTRSRANSKGVELNLIPMMDALVVIISFLMSTMAFIALVDITSLVPIISESKDFNKKPLQLTLSLSEKNTLIWSPFQLITDRSIPHLENGLPDTEKIHQSLVEIKQRFPEEKQIILAPHAQIPYENLIEVIDAVRTLNPLDDKIYKLNKETGAETADDGLFPEITFGNLLE